jgi:hypothetical protein
MEIRDSGARRRFVSGAVRDVRIGKGRFDLLPMFALTRLAGLLEKGCEKYGARNWEKGMGQTTFLDSALRHLAQHMIGLQDEDHLAAAAFNVMAALDQDERICRGLLPLALDDRPRHGIRRVNPDCEED